VPFAIPRITATGCPPLFKSIVIGVPALHWKLRGTVTVVSVVLVGLYSPNPRVALLIVQALATVAVTVTVLVGSAAWAVSGLPTKECEEQCG